MRLNLFRCTKEERLPSCKPRSSKLRNGGLRLAKHVALLNGHIYVRGIQCRCSLEMPTTVSTALKVRDLLVSNEMMI